MHEIVITPKEIKGNVSYEGIEFSQCTFIDIYIDGISIKELAEFESGVVYWDQLQKSIEQSGQYLLFTCYCGIPEDAGWDNINVEISEDEVIWYFEREKELRYVFKKSEYVEQVNSCKSKLNLTEYPLAISVSELPNH